MNDLICESIAKNPPTLQITPLVGLLQRVCGFLVFWFSGCFDSLNRFERKVKRGAELSVYDFRTIISVMRRSGCITDTLCSIF